MKKAFLIITMFALLFSCATKKTTIKTEHSRTELKSVDSLNSKIKELNSYKEKLQDSIFELHKIIQTKETTIIKASSLKTEMENLCDSLGNLKDFSQTLGNSDFELRITALNGKLQIVSSQLNDLISTKEKLVIENTRLESYIKSSESKHSQEITSLKTKLTEEKEKNYSLSQELEEKIRWSKWTYVFLLTTIILLLILFTRLKNIFPNLV